MMRRWHLVVGLLVIMAGGALWGIGLQPPRTIEDAVAATLVTYGAVDPEVRMIQAACMPSRDICLRVVGDITVSGSDETGRLSCAAYWRGCTLTMASYGLRLAPVPDVAEPHPALVQLETWQLQIGMWLRSGPGPR